MEGRREVTMSNMYGDPADAPLGRSGGPMGGTATQPTQQMHMPPHMRPEYMQGEYGHYGPPPWVAWRGRARGSETKPFFLTSEFVGMIVGIVALGITAGASESIDARMFWIL